MFENEKLIFLDLKMDVRGEWDMRSSCSRHMVTIYHAMLASWKKNAT
jgi:hypothetical protein